MVPPADPPEGLRRLGHGREALQKLHQRIVARRGRPQGVRLEERGALPPLRRDLPGRRPPPAPSGPRRRQGHRRGGGRSPGRVHDADRSELRGCSHDQKERCMSRSPAGGPLRARTSDVVRAGPPDGRRARRHAPVPRVLRLRRRRAAQRLHARAVAAHHDLASASARFAARRQPGRRRPGPAALLLPGGRVPTPGCGPPPRHRPGRRTRRLGPTGRRRAARSCVSAGGRRLGGPSQRDRPVGTPDRRPGLGDGDARARRVATYLAGYATKSSSEHPRLDARIASERDLDARALPPHLHRMVAWPSSWPPTQSSPHLNLARHAHRLGFGGHFLTKSRGYSTTFGALRQARVHWREARRLGGSVPDGHLSEGHWQAIGAGWANQGEALFAGHQQRQRAEDRQLCSSGTPERVSPFAEAEPPQAVRQLGPTPRRPSGPWDAVARRPAASFE